MKIQLLITQQQTIALVAVTDAGASRPLPGKPVVTTSNAAVAQAVLSPDGSSVTVIAEGLGDARINIAGAPPHVFGDVIEVIVTDDAVKQIKLTPGKVALQPRYQTAS